MTTTPLALIKAKFAENTQTTQYTSTNCKTRIIKFVAANRSGSTATISANIVASGSSAASSNEICPTVSVLAGGRYYFPELVGQDLESGDFISTNCSASSAIVIYASGNQTT